MRSGRDANANVPVYDRHEGMQDIWNKTNNIII